MEPPVIPNCKMESELVILQIIFTDIDMETVTGDIVERFIFYFDFLFCISAADVSWIGQFFFDLSEIILSQGNVQCSLYRFCLLYTSDAADDDAVV